MLQDDGEGVAQPIDPGRRRVVQEEGALRASFWTSSRKVDWDGRMSTSASAGCSVKGEPAKTMPAAWGLPETVIVPGAPSNRAVAPLIQVTLEAPSHQLVEDSSQAPEPPVPSGPHVKVCASTCPTAATQRKTHAPAGNKLRTDPIVVLSIPPPTGIAASTVPTAPGGQHRRACGFRSSDSDANGLHAGGAHPQHLFQSGP